MEIEFNTNKVGKPDPGQPVSRPDAAKPVREDAPSFPNIDALETKLKEVPLVRHEKVQRAKALISDVKYPPDEMLVGIANLLAMRMK
jgi:hypothetical protein